MHLRNDKLGTTVSFVLKQKLWKKTLFPKAKYSFNSKQYKNNKVSTTQHSSHNSENKNYNETKTKQFNTHTHPFHHDPL